MKSVSALVGMFTATWLSVACADGEPCDPGMELWGNYCVMPEDAEPEEEAGGAGGEAGDSGDGGEISGDDPVEPDEFFGVTCTADNEGDVCGGAAPSCGLAPGAAEGACTTLGCADGGVVCPIGWSCLSFADVCTED